MDQDNKPNMDVTPKPDELSGKDLSRRRFTKSIAGSGVILTLTSQPVLGTYATKCTISGHLSGNLSRAAETTSCNPCGKGKDYWELHDECKKKTFYQHMGSECEDNKDSTKDHRCSWVFKPSYENFCLRRDDTSTKYGYGYWNGSSAPTKYYSYPNNGYSAGKYAGRRAVDVKGSNAYKDVQFKGYRDGFYNAYKNKCVNWSHSYSQQEYQRGYRAGYEERCMEQYGYESNHCQGEKWDFARECLISVLNCKVKCVNNYPVTEQQVKSMWNACKDGGKYEVRQGTNWSRTDCMNYLKKLHT